MLKNNKGIKFMKEVSKMSKQKAEDAIVTVVVLGILTTFGSNLDKNIEG